MKTVATLSLSLMLFAHHGPAAADSAGAIYSGTVGCNTEQATVNVYTPLVTNFSIQNDTYIELQRPNDNFGASTAMIVDREATDLQRALVRFNLGSIPAGSTINSATLKMQASNIGGSITVGAYRIKESWNVSQVTWNARSSGVNWTTPGGELDNVALSSITTAATGQHSFDITSLAQSWLAGTVANDGVMILSADGGSDRTVTYDTQDLSGGVPPVLEVSYSFTSAVSGCFDVPTGEDLNITAFSSSTGMFTATVNGQVLYIPQSAVALH